MHFKSRVTSGFFIYVSIENNFHKKSQMKLYLRFIILLIFACIFFFGCNSETNQDKLNVRFGSIRNAEWIESGAKFYLINLSMRKIDSLSAELNLKFTKKNAQGL